MPYLIGGFLIRQYQPRLLRKIPSAVWLICDIILLSVSMALEPKNELFYSIINLIVSLVLHTWGALMAFYILQRLASCIKWQGNAMFCFLSKRSMAIYMFHQQIIYFVLYYLNGKVHPLWLGVLSFVISITISALIASLLMKFKVSRFLVGEK